MKFFLTIMALVGVYRTRGVQAQYLINLKSSKRQGLLLSQYRMCPGILLVQTFLTWCNACMNVHMYVLLPVVLVHVHVLLEYVYVMYMYVRLPYVYIEQKKIPKLSTVVRIRSSTSNPFNPSKSLF